MSSYSTAVATSGGETVSAEGRMRAIAALHLGTNFELKFDELDYIAATLAAEWNTNAGVAVSTAYPTAVSCSGAAADYVYKRQIVDLRTDKWFFGGIFKIAGVIGSGAVKGFALDSAAAVDPIDGVEIGVVQAVSATKFAMRSLISSAATASAASTIDYDNNAHAFYAWSDGTVVKFSVDFEAEITLTSTMTNLVSGGNIYQRAGVFATAASNAAQIGATCFGNGFKA